MRRVILHYHLFKCAGTSFDAVLKRSFEGRWATAEFPVRGEGNPSGVDNAALVGDWIASHPDIAAFSTHTGIGPVPRVPGVEIVPVLFVRAPLPRIRSAYEFERTRPYETPGVLAAREGGLEAYAKRRLTWRHDRQVRDFQTYRLAAFEPGPGDELERALRALRTLPFVGVVERFEASLQRLAALLPDDLALSLDELPHRNRGPVAPATPLPGEAAAVLEPHNRRDAALHSIATEMLERP